MGPVHQLLLPRQPLQDRQEMVLLGHGKQALLPALLLLLVLPYSLSYPQSLEDLMAGSLARETYLGRQDLRYQLAEPFGQILSITIKTRHTGQCLSWSLESQ